MRGLVDLFAQYERALIRSRTTAALAVKKGRGERVGAVPIGFRTTGGQQQLCIEPTEQAALTRLRELRETGHSMRSIAAILNAEGVPPRGKRWYATTIARLLLRAA
jgi:DNA invertase Pin-like site-specific DNA recombinase